MGSCKINAHFDNKDEEHYPWPVGLRSKIHMKCSAQFPNHISFKMIGLLTFVLQNVSFQSQMEMEDGASDMEDDVVVLCAVVVSQCGKYSLYE